MIVEECVAMVKLCHKTQYDPKAPVRLFPWIFMANGNGMSLLLAGGGHGGACF
jgi:hypothetical protein